MRASTASETLWCRLLSDPPVGTPTGPIRLRSRLQRTLLLRLAAAGGAPVSRPDLVQALWPDDPPRTAGELLSTHAARLRSSLADHVGPDRQVVPRSEDGYRLDTDLVRVDTLELARTLERADRESDDGALRASRDALVLLSGVTPTAQVDYCWLVDAIEAAWQDARAICQLNIERLPSEVEDDHEVWAQLLPTLEQLAHRSPFDEPVISWRLQALASTGRVAEALQVMDDVRARLRDELGASPSAVLEDSFAALLRLSDAPPAAPRIADQGGTAAVCRPVPQQVPPPRPDFTGRRAEIESLLRHLTEDSAPRANAVPRQALITGRAGVGKSALASAVADAAREHYPDGQCYIDFSDIGLRDIGLREGDEQIDLAAALTSILLLFGVAGDHVPGRVPDQLSLLRSVTADLAVLWVLDNVGAEHELSGLFPSSPRSALIVTSRSVHPDLTSAYACELPGLARDEALELLVDVAGRSTVMDEPQAADELVALCEGLPRALMLSGRQLRTHPHRTVAQLVHRLQDSGKRLDAFSVGGGMRSALQHTVRGLEPAARRAFGGLGLLRVGQCRPWMLAAVLGVTDDEARDLLEDLVEARLIEAVPPREADVLLHFRIGDLAREHALECRRADSDPGTDRDAVARYARRLLQVVQRGHAGEGRAGTPEARRVARALTTADLVGAVRLACELELDELATDLAVGFAESAFLVRHTYGAWRQSHDLVLDRVSERALDLVARLALSYAELCFKLDDSPAAERWLGRASDSAEAVGNTHILQRATLFSAGIAVERGHCDDGIDRLTTLLAGDPPLSTRADALLRLSRAQRDVGRYDGAEASARQALAAYRTLNQVRGEGFVWRSLGLTARAQGHYDDATDRFSRSLAVFEEVEEPLMVAYARQGLIKTALRAGQQIGREGLDACLDTTRRLDDRFGEALMTLTLGQWHLSREDWSAALEQLDTAAERWVLLALEPWQVRTDRDRATALAALGRADEAADIRSRARDRAVDLGLREVEEPALMDPTRGDPASVLQRAARFTPGGRQIG